MKLCILQMPAFRFFALITAALYFLIKPVNLLFIHFKYGADKNLSAVSGINKAQIPVFIISAEDDIFYGGKKSPIYQYQKTNPKNKINKDLYMEHDKAILEMICSFFTN